MVPDENKHTVAPTRRWHGYGIVSNKAHERALAERAVAGQGRSPAAGRDPTGGVRSRPVSQNATQKSTTTFHWSADRRWTETTEVHRVNQQRGIGRPSGYSRQAPWRSRVPSIPSHEARVLDLTSPWSCQRVFQDRRRASWPVGSQRLVVPCDAQARSLRGRTGRSAPFSQRPRARRSTASPTRPGSPARTNRPTR